MKTQIIKHTEMPFCLPHGATTEIAKYLGVHRNTVNRAMRAQKGPMFERVKKVALDKYGK
jgi:IS30 family transposase